MPWPAQARPGDPPREPAVPRRGGGERSRVREGAGELRRRLRERRLRDGAPRARLDRGDRADPPGLRRLPHGARDRSPLGAPGGASAALRGRHRGAKVSGKLEVLTNLIRKVDIIVVGGGMANTFLFAQGRGVGRACSRPRWSTRRRRSSPRPRSAGSSSFCDRRRGREGGDTGRREEDRAGRQGAELLVHRGLRPGEHEAFQAGLDEAKTVLWNGPLGVFEIPTFGDGTRAMARYLARVRRPASRSSSAGATLSRPSSSSTWPRR